MLAMERRIDDTTAKHHTEMEHGYKTRWRIYLTYTFGNDSFESNNPNYPIRYGLYRTSLLHKDVEPLDAQMKKICEEIIESGRCLQQLNNFCENPAKAFQDTQSYQQGESTALPQSWNNPNVAYAVQVYRRQQFNIRKNMLKQHFEADHHIKNATAKKLCELADDHQLKTSIEVIQIDD
uniref:Uncharacterized protein n=1 Tax=Panagrolaimus superbus TaxID=310955 RepID=A0A914YPH5_9BILA